MRKTINLILLLLLVVVTVVLSLANRQEVLVNYLLGSFRLPLILVMVGSLLVGMLIQYLLFLSKAIAAKQEVKALKRDKENLTLQLTQAKQAQLK